MKIKYSALVIFRFYFHLFSPVSFVVGVLVSAGGDSVSNQMLGHATPTDLAVSVEIRRPSLWVRCVPACIHTSPNPKRKTSRVLHVYIPSQTVFGINKRQY